MTDTILNRDRLMQRLTDMNRAIVAKHNGGRPSVATDPVEALDLLLITGLRIALLAEPGVDPEDYLRNRLVAVRDEAEAIADDA